MNKMNLVMKSSVTNVKEKKMFFFVLSGVSSNFRKVSKRAKALVQEVKI